MNTFTGRRNSSSGFEEIIFDLQYRLQALQQQYTFFVKNTTDMIKFHWTCIDQELKNDPNTPRELINLVSKHGASLEKHIFLASAELSRPDQQKFTRKPFENFEASILDIVSQNEPEGRKKKNISRVFEEIEAYVQVRYVKKEDISGFQKEMNETIRIDMEKIKLNNAEVASENQKLIEANQKLLKKIIILKSEVKEKEKKFKSMDMQLGKIKKMQDDNFRNFRSNYCSKIASPELIFTEELHSPDISSPSLIKYDESIESQQCIKVVFQKLGALGKVMKKFMSNGMILQEIITREKPEYSYLVRNLRNDTGEIEKTIEDIVTPRFRGEILERVGSPNEENYEKVVKKMKKDLDSAILDVKSKEDMVSQLNSALEVSKLEIKQLHSIILSLKKNSKICERENQELKKSLKTQKHTEMQYETKPSSAFSIVSNDVISINGIYRYDNILREIRKQLMEKDRELIDIKFQMSKKQVKEVEVLTEFNDLEEKNQAMVKIKHISQENSMLSKKISQIISEKAKLQEELNDCNTKVENLLEQINVLTETNETIRSQFSCGYTCFPETNDKEMMIRDYEHPFKPLQIYNESSILISPSSNKNTLYSKITALESELSLLKTENTQTKSLETEIKSENKGLLSELNRLQSENSKLPSLESEILSLKLQNSKISSSHSKLQIENKSLQNLSEKLTSELSSLKIELSKSLASINDLKTENSYLSIVLDEKSSEISALQSSQQANEYKMSELKESLNQSIQNTEKLTNAKIILEKYLQVNLLNSIKTTPIIDSLCVVLEINRPILKIPMILKK